MQPDPTPEISQEAARAMLAALHSVNAWLDRDPKHVAMDPKAARLAQNWARGVFGSELRAAIALAEGRAS
jgi:hypothetical protein